MTEFYEEEVFSSLDPRAKEIAYELMSHARDKKHLVRMLDVDDTFRAAIGCPDHDVYPKEVDCIARVYDEYQQKRAKL